MIVLVDIDGTCADNSHRLHFIEPPCPKCSNPPGMWYARSDCDICKGTGISKKQADWDAFYEPERLLADKPIGRAQVLLPRIIRRPGTIVFFHTGRPEKTRTTTISWLHQHIYDKVITDKLPVIAFIQDSPQLIMRPDGDHRPAKEYKEELPKRLWRLNYGPVLFLDDDERNEEIYFRYGIFLKAPECWDVMR